MGGLQTVNSLPLCFVFSFQAKKVELIFLAMKLVSGGQSGHQGIPSTPYPDRKLIEK